VAFGLDGFKASALGQRIGAIITDPVYVTEMMVLSKHDIPALQAVGRPLLEQIGDEVRPDPVKKLIGRWVREILDEKALLPGRTGRIPSGHLFSTGAIYYPKG